MSDNGGASATGAALEVNARIVYWGIAGAGKTTSVETIHAKMRPDHRGDLKRVPTRLDPSVQYDELPIALGNVQGARTQLQIVAVPGGSEHLHTRKQLLDRVDGLVLVIDADPARADDNVTSIDELRACLDAYGRSLDELPFVVQYNKRDLCDPYAIEALHKRLGFGQAPVFETVATEGQGVLQVLSTISKGVVRALRGRPTSGPAAAPSSTQPVAQPVKQPVAQPVKQPVAQPVTPTAAPAPAAVGSAPLAATDDSIMDPGKPLSLDAAQLSDENAPAIARPFVETVVDLDTPGAVRGMLDAEPVLDPLSMLEAAILSEGDGLTEIGAADEAANRTELAFDKPWAQLVDEKPAPGARFGADLRVVSVGTAERSGERGVRVPLVLGNDDGETLTVALTVQLDPLLEDDPG